MAQENATKLLLDDGEFRARLDTPDVVADDVATVLPPVPI
jgi:hypothetical protein